MAAIVEAVRWFFRALRTLRAYPVNNEISLRILKEFGPRFADVLPLSLTVASEQFEWQGTPLLDDRGLAPSLVHSLYRDGIRRIRFDPGMDRDQMCRLLLALARPLDANDLSEDFVTRLWETDLPHVRLSALDPYLDVHVTEEAVLEGKHTPTEGDVEASEEEEAAILPPPPEQAFEIEEGDKARLAEQIQRAADSTRWLDFVHASLDTAAMPTGERRSADVVEIIEASFHSLVRQRQLVAAQDIVQRLKRVASPVEAPMFGPVLERIAQPDRLSALHEALEAKSCDPRDVLTLLVQLAPASVGAVCTFLGESTSAAARRIYTEALKHIGDPAVPIVVERFRASSGEIRCAYAVALRGLQDPTVVSVLLEALEDPDQKVRHETVRALATQTDRRASAALLRIAFDDLDETSRLIALRGLATALGGRGLSNLLRRIDFPEHGALSAEEKTLLFRLVAAHGTDAAVPVLRKVLTPSWVPGRQRSADWAGAARALAQIGTPAALSVLEEFSRNRRSELASICAGALRTGTRKQK